MGGLWSILKYLRQKKIKGDELLLEAYMDFSSIKLSF